MIPFKLNSGYRGGYYCCIGIYIMTKILSKKIVKVKFSYGVKSMNNNFDDLILPIGIIVTHCNSIKWKL